jgi:hypothetical protein
MPVYRLMPVAGTETNPQWRASTMRPYCLWVRADDEGEARCQAAQATAVMHAPGEPDVPAPWCDAGLVHCNCDDTKSVAAGIIRVRRLHAPGMAA